MGLRDKDMLVLQDQSRLVTFPICFVGAIPPPNSLSVYSDCRTGVRLGIEHLMNLGHRHIAYLSGPSDNSLTAIERFKHRVWLLGGRESHHFGIRAPDGSAANPNRDFLQYRDSGRHCR